MRAMPKRSLCQQSVDTVLPPELLHNTDINTNTNKNTNSLCQQSIDTVLPSELLLFRRFFSNQSPISTSCCGRVTDTKIVTFKCLLRFLGVKPTHIFSWFLKAVGYDVPEPWQIIMTREIGPSTPSPLLFPHSLNLLDRSPGRNFPFLHLLQEFRGLNSFNKRTEGSGKQLLCEFPSFMKLFSEILDTSCVELNECQAAHQHKESLSKLSKIQ